MLDKLTVGMLPPHITDLSAVYNEGDIDALSKYPLVSLHLKVKDRVSLNKPENFPALVRLEIRSKSVCSGVVSLPSGLKHLRAKRANIIYNDASLDFCVVSGNPAKIPASAYCRAKVVNVYLTIVGRDSMHAMLDAISPDVERIKLHTYVSIAIDDDAAGGVEYDFSRFVKCHDLKVRFVIRPTVYPPRLLSLFDECDDFDKTYPQSLRSLATDRRLSAKEIASLSNIHDLTCVVGTDVLTNSDCISHINGRISFTTNLSATNVDVFVNACSSDRWNSVDVYDRDGTRYEW